MLENRWLHSAPRREIIERYSITLLIFGFCLMVPSLVYITYLCCRYPLDTVDDKLDKWLEAAAENITWKRVTHYYNLRGKLIKISE